VRVIGLKVVVLLATLMLFGVAFVVAGCGDDNGSGGDTTTTDTTTTDTTTDDTTTDETTTDDDTTTDETTTDGDTTTDETETDTTTETASALQGSVGPGFTISLSDANGNPVETLSAGSYELQIDDQGTSHNFHLSGAGVDVATDVGSTGTESQSVNLQAGTYSFVCDPHASQMSGSFQVD
jgi:hypothetical protein